jgi:hypothetical protein
MRRRAGAKGTESGGKTGLGNRADRTAGSRASVSGDCAISRRGDARNDAAAPAAAAAVAGKDKRSEIAR